MKSSSIPEKIIKCSFNLSVWLIEFLFGTNKLKTKVEALNKLAEGTLGKEIAQCLKEHQLNLVPGYESHDLKHVLLGYEMTPLDEIRMQAFMLGNGNWSIPSLTIFLYGAILLPHKWSIFRLDFIKGRRAIPIKHWTIEAYAEWQLNELQELIFTQYKTERINFSLNQIIRFVSFAVIIAGLFGMLFCFPFLWSANIADLVGAGFPFVAGAILVVGGLLNLSILSQQVQVEKI